MEVSFSWSDVALEDYWYYPTFSVRATQFVMQNASPEYIGLRGSPILGAAQAVPFYGPYYQCRYDAGIPLTRNHPCVFVLRQDYKGAGRLSCHFINLLASNS